MELSSAKQFFQKEPAGHGYEVEDLMSPSFEEFNMDFCCGHC